LLLEPLEDRQLLAATPVLGPLPTVSQAAYRTDMTPDATTSAQVQGPVQNPSATSAYATTPSATTTADATPDPDSASYATAATSSPASYTPASGQQTSYAPQSNTGTYTTQHVAYAQSSHTVAYGNAPGSENAAYPTTPQTTAGSTATSAVLGLAAATARGVAQQALALANAPQPSVVSLPVDAGGSRTPAVRRLEVVAVPPPNASPAPESVARQPAAPVMQVPEQTAALSQKQELPPDVILDEVPGLVPLVLPIPGTLLPADVAAWEQRVRDVFRRLDALTDSASADSLWLRLAPWCAAAGVMTVALEVARRQLNRRLPPGLFETASRGLAWHWPDDPEDDHDAEQP
jgi:hypothetical protein